MEAAVLEPGRMGHCKSCGAQSTDHEQQQISAKERGGGDVGRRAMCKEIATLGKWRHGRWDDGDVVGVHE
jgi:hypothetical protein